MTHPILASVLVASGMFAIPVSAPVVPEGLTIRAVSITGNHAVSTAVLAAAMDLSPGQDVSYPQLQRALYALNTEYLSRGYAFCGVLSNRQLYYDRETQTLEVAVIEPRLHAVRWVGQPAGDPAELVKRAGLQAGEVLHAAPIKRLMSLAVGAGTISPPRPYIDASGEQIDLEFDLPQIPQKKN